jgi:type VI secretion system protein ImpE
MDLKELLRAGQIDEALAAAKDRVRAAPSSTEHRIALFEIFSLVGEWERALNQLSVAGELDGKLVPFAHLYRAALASEVLRDAVFAGRRAPTVLGDPDPWVAGMIEALGVAGRGHAEEAMSLRARSLDEAPTWPGRLGDTAFEVFGDADPRLGPILEAVVDGAYSWIPVRRLRSLEVEAPGSLRDTIWIRAHLELTNEGRLAALIPVRYPGSERSDDADARLAKKTTWQDAGGGLFVGEGQRMMIVDDDEKALLELGAVTFDGDGES